MAVGENHESAQSGGDAAVTRPRNNPQVTRLAPSPTGALHLGNARTFLVNWALARSKGWRVAMRVEDLDTPRVKPGVIGRTLETLAWLGLDWDGDAVIQSDHADAHAAAMESLARAGRVYPCELTRSEIEAAASAPHEGEREQRFPPELRPAGLGPRAFDDPSTNWRFLVDPGAVSFEDRFAGPQRVDPGAGVGDFVVWTKRGSAAYQLAVVVDDAAAGVTQIVRGDDLIDSAGRQLLLYRALGLAPEPACWHLPLVRGVDGRRLAKRHGDTRIDTYRAQGVEASRIIGLCASWCGITAERSPMDLAEFQSRLDLNRMPRTDVVFGREDDAWLTG
ncbi:MAG: glutamate--tRNA ligase family protein [Phycisphaerales bacterium]